MSALILGLTIAVLFAVLWPCVSFAIEQTELRRVNKILAPAAALLCIIAMLESLGNDRVESLTEKVLIPWAALGYSILFVLLLSLLGFLRGKVHEYFEDKSGPSEGEDDLNSHQSWSHYDKRSVDCDDCGHRERAEHKQGALAWGNNRSWNE